MECLSLRVTAGTGLVYMLCWPLYSGQLYARWLCASVPAAASLHYLCVGLGVLPSQLTVIGSTVGRLLEAQNGEHCAHVT